ncbi:MAG: hypothetical protein ACKVX7_10970 [Planctomycetota bacterium]
MRRSKRNVRALTVGGIAFFIAASVAWGVIALFGAGSRLGGALVGGSVVAIISVAAALGRGRLQNGEQR